jgi:hypothetical protein
MKNRLKDELVDECHNGDKYPMKIGKSFASSLSGFIAGFIAATIGWAAIVYMLEPFCER